MAKIDELTIEIKDNAKETARNFDTLSNSLKKLSSVDTKSLDRNLKSISQSIKTFSNNISKINTTNLSKVADSLDKISSSGNKTIQQTSHSVNELNKSFANTSGIKKSQQAMKDYENTIKNIAKTPMPAKFLDTKGVSNDWKNPLREAEARLRSAGMQGSYANDPDLKAKYGNKFKASDILGAVQKYKVAMQEVQKVQSQFNPSQLMKGARYTDTYKRLAKDITNAEKDLNRFYETQAKMNAVGLSDKTLRYKNTEFGIENTTKKLQGLYAEMNKLQAEGGDVINPNSFDRLSEKSSKVQSVLQSLTKSLRAGGFGGTASGIQKLSANVGSLSNGLAGAGASAETAGTAMAGLQTAIPVIGLILAAVTLLIKAFTSLAKTVINVMKKIGSAIKKVVVGVKNLVSSILSIGSSSYQAKTAVGKFLNRIINMFKSRILRQAITKAIEYAKQGFKDLNAYSESIGSPFHNNVKTIVADLKWLGRSIAAAFEPIINVATPILDWLIDKIVTVINYINQFFAALTGKSTWTKATKGASDYADATGGASKAQKDLNKQIREWDKLNVITNPNKDKGSGGSGASSGGGGGFTTEEVSNNIKNLAKKFKETWENGADFTWLGADLGKKLGEALDKIPWDNIKENARKAGKALATLINGFVEVPGLAEKLGHAIAEGINTLLSGFEGFVGEIHGDSIGTFIGNLVKTALADIEWDKYITSMGKLGEELAKAVNALADTEVLSEISKSFAKLLKGAIEGAYKFVTGIKWDELGTKIGNSISDFFKEMNKVDKDGMTGFQKLGKTVSGLATGLMDMISNALDSIEWDKVGQSVVDFLTSIDWLDVIGKALTLKSKISNALWELFKAAIKGIGQLNIDVSIKLVEKIQEKLNDAKKYLKDKAIDFAANFPKWSDVSKKISNIVTNLKKKFKIDFKLQIPSWSSIKSKFDSIINGIKKLFKLDLSFKSNAKTQTVSTSIAGSVIEKAVKKVTKKANGGIYSNGTWKQFAVGGFPSHGTQFVAGEHGAEVVGHINGRTEVLNKSQIAQAMAGAVVNGNAEQNALLRQQNEYLRQLLLKDNSISYRDVFKATQKGANEYKAVTGNPAFI